MAHDRPTGETVAFFRANSFYLIQLSGNKPTELEVPEHVALNPGTIRVESLDGQYTWPPKVTQ